MDEEKSFFTRFRNYGLKIKSPLIHNTDYYNDKCNNCKKKSFFASLFDRSDKACEDSRALRSPCTEKWLSKEENFIQSPPEASCSKKPPKKPPKKPVIQYECTIREQNPLSPCCCIEKTEDDDDTPCPPNFFNEPRAPTCGCDLCRKSGYHCRCCNRRGCTDTPPTLETA